MGIYKETIRKYMIGHQMRQVVANNGVLDLDQFYLDATAVGATQDKTLFESELEALPDLVKNEAETILVPGIYKNGKVYGFNGSTKGLVEFNFTRASSGTYFDKNGIMQVAPAGIPRIEYDPETGSVNGYLQEKETVNLFSYSIPPGDYSTQFNKGSLLAVGQRLQKPSSGNVNAVAAATNENNAVYTLSFFVKVGTGKVPVIGGNNSDNDFDIMVKGTSGYTLIETLIKPIGNGVYRVSITSNSNTWTGTNDRFGVVKRDGHSEHDVIVTGYQLEKNDRGTSYIPTSVAAVARASDVFESVFDVVPYPAATLRFDMDLLTNRDIQSIMVDKKDTLIRFLYEATNATKGRMRNNTDVISHNIDRIPYIPFKVAVSYKTGVAKICYYDSVYTAALTDTFVSDNPLQFSASNVSRNLIRSLAIFSRQLTDQEHIDITS